MPVPGSCLGCGGFVYINPLSGIGNIYCQKCIRRQRIFNNYGGKGTVPPTTPKPRKCYHCSNNAVTFDQSGNDSCLNHKGMTTYVGSTVPGNRTASGIAAAANAARTGKYGFGFTGWSTPTGGTQVSVKILWDDSVQAYRVATPYNPKFVELLKQLIPIAERVWEPFTKIWTIASQYGDAVRNLCEQVYGKGSVTYVSQQDAIRIAQDRAAAASRAQAAAQSQWNQYQPPPPPKTPVRGDPLSVVMLAFVQALPYEAAKAAYRRAALDLHPDRNGGDSSKMTVINAAWSRIEKEFYGKGGN